MKYYITYHSLAGSSYKAQTGKDGVSEDDMRDLRRIAKGSRKAMAKGNRLDTVSIELVTENGWEQMDVAVMVEDRDEYARLHEAIAALPPDQQALIHSVFFQGISQRAIARAEGVSEYAVRYRLKAIYAQLKISLE